MRTQNLIPLLAILLGISLVSSGQRVSAQTDTPPTPAPLVSGSSQAGSMNIDPPDALTTFTINNPYCYQPDPNVDKCQVNFRYIQASDNQSSAPYMTWLSIKISGKNRYMATAFFEGTIYYYYGMAPEGLTVPCGSPNAGGAGTLYGNVYGVSVQPLDSSHNPMSTDIANVTCPAYNP